MKYIIENELSLIEALKTHFPESSRRTHENWIKGGRVLVDERVQKRANSPLKPGQSLSLGQKEPGHLVEGIPLLYEDRWMIVIDKPAGLLSVPAEREEINAFHLLKFGLKTHSLFPVHRLDQETSGVLLFARSKIAEEQFNLLFHDHLLEREYVAILEGHIPEKQGTWENYLREKENYDVEVASSQDGKKAITHFELIRFSKKFTYVRFKLETGKKHQIRVQASYRGHPIVGDKRYGSLINPFKRVCLHAQKLAFTHPFTHKPLVFSSSPSFL